ncbi:thiamine phosphate synthase [Megalodesulfovibrio paquesii]
MRPRLDYRAYLVTNRALCLGRDLLDVVAAAVQGGVTLVQIREKDADARDFVELGRALKELLDRHRIPLLVNDRVDVAQAIGAAGVHVGQSDIPFIDVRRILGPEAIIGLSIDTMEQALAVPDLDQVLGGAGLGPDYLGVGPIYPTATKADAGEAWGLEKLTALRRQSHQTLVGIGGITAQNAPDVIRAGADGVAVVSAIVSAPDPAAAARELLDVVTAARA